MPPPSQRFSLPTSISPPTPPPSPPPSPSSTPSPSSPSPSPSSTPPPTSPPLPPSPSTLSPSPSPSTPPPPPPSPSPPSTPPPSTPPPSPPSLTPLSPPSSLLLSIPLLFLPILLFISISCKNILKHIYNFSICTYFFIYNSLIIFIYIIYYLIYFLLTYSLIFFFYICFYLFYKLLTYSLILIIFINLSNTLYASENAHCSDFQNIPNYVNDKAYQSSFYININIDAFNLCTVTSDYHIFLSQWHYTQTFPLGDISSGSNNGKNDLFFIFLSLMPFLFKLVYKKKIKHGVFNYFNFYVIFLFLSNFLFKNETNISLKNCTKIEFFTIETIKESNYVSKQYLQGNLYLLPISKLKYNRYFGYFGRYSLILQLLLLLAGDINPNPGPQEPQLNKMWEPFVKRDCILFTLI